MATYSYGQALKCPACSTELVDVNPLEFSIDAKAGEHEDSADLYCPQCDSRITVAVVIKIVRVERAT